MLDKKKAKLRRQQEAAADKRFRYSIRKFNVGVASVAIAAFMFLGGGAVVSADDTAVSEPQTAASSTGDSSSATSEAQTATSTEATSTASEASTSTEAAATSTEAATSESAATSTEATSTASEASTSTATSTASSEATSTTASTASETASNTASTPTTVEEAKTVLEQVISEAEVLAQEASRQAVSSTEDASALQTAAQATKLVATEATVTFQNALATLEEVNAQISAVRTSVDALVLELRKYLGTDLIQVALTTTTDMNNSVGKPGYWIEDVTVTNKDTVVTTALTSPAVSTLPDGYAVDPTTGRATYLVFTLSNIGNGSDDDNAVADGTANGSFNNRMGTDYYITLSVDGVNTTGNVYARLVSKSTGLIEEISISEGTTGRFKTLDNLVANNQSLLRGFNFRIPLTKTTYTNAAGESSTLRETQILQGTQGNAQGQVIYAALTGDKGYYNDYSGPAPTYSPKQTTYYLVKETDKRIEEFLASYTQIADLSGDNFTIAGPATFDNYELIESPEITAGTIASDYTEATSIIRFWGDYLESKVQYITDSDGSSRFLNFVINPDNADFLANYAKYKTMSQTDFQKDGETVLRINERMAIVNQLETDIATVNKSTTLTDDEKKAKIAELRATASAAVNTADDAFLLMFVSEEIAPKGYNENGDAITTEHSWEYTSTKYYFKDTRNNTISNKMGAATGAFSGYPNANWINSNGSYLQVVDADGNVITNTTTNTDMKFKNINLSMFNGNTLNQNDQRYYYAEKGGVKVYYVDTEGNVLQSDVTIYDHADTNTAYDTKSVKDATITTADGTVYYYKEIDTTGLNPASSNTDTEKRTIEKITEEVGTVAQDTLKELTYVYEKAGSVNVNYVDTDGNPLQASVVDVTNGQPGSDYDTVVDNKPTTITTADGKTYQLVPAGTYNVGTVGEGNNLTAVGNGTATGIDDTTGTVESGVTKEITYVYQEVKGNVIVHYVDQDGNPISGTTDAGTTTESTVEDTPESSTGTPYDTTDLKPNTITTADGKVYRLVPAATKGNETGDVVVGTTEITYVYELVQGDVIVHYVDTEGNTIASDVTDTPTSDTGTDYDTTDNKPEKIVNDTTGDVYYYKEVKAGDNETGKVVEGTTEVTYIYEKAGSVNVNYVDTDGNVIKTKVADETDVKPGTAYDTVVDNKPETIATADGKLYRLVPAGTYNVGTVSDSNNLTAAGNGTATGVDSITGTVEAGTTKEITYVYEEVKGDVVVEYYDTEGNVIATTVVDTPITSTGTPYSTLDQKPSTITTADGTVYYYKEVKDTSASTTGEVVEGTTTVQYVYEKAGNVIVHYITEDGTVIKATVTDEENAEPGKSYTTTDNKPTTITTEDGTVYELIPTATIGNEDGSVEAGKTIEVTYVYRKVETPTPDVKTGSVVIRYVEAGNESNVLKDPVLDENAVVTGTKYDTTDEGDKPAEIVKDGVRYVLVPSKTTAVDPNGNPVTETGEVAEGTTVVTYKYQKVANWIPQIPATPENPTPVNPVIPYPFDPTNPDKPIDPTTPYPGGEVPSIPHVPGFTPVDPKTNEPLKPVDPTDPSKGYVPPTPDESGIDTPIPYVQNGNVVVNYVTEDGTVIKAPVQDETDAPAGKSYDTTDNKPNTITTEDGTVYELIPTATIGNEDGSVEAGKTIEVTYVYRKVETPTPDVKTGSVVIRYVEAGNESNVLKDPVLDENAVVTGTKYDTTDEGDKPAEIVKDGVRYVLVPSKTTAVDPNGNPVTETGEVAEGTTVVTYKYQKVANWIPQIPATPENPTPVNPVIPYPFDPTNPDKPIDPTTPYPGGEVPSIPHVPGFTPVDPKTNEPLKPVDPTDPSKGYVPPTPDESGIDTPIPYVQNGNVVVNYVDENGNVIKTPVNDETDAPAGKSYDTTDNKPTEIVTEDGSRYVLIPSKTVGSETGSVEGGKTTEITYVYKKVANWIPQIPATPENPTPVNPVIPYPFDPTNPDKPIDPTTPGTNGEVPSIPHVPGFTPVDPKTNEPLKPVDPTDPSKGYVPPTPDESGIDTPIPYVQNGNVVVNYVDENGNVIKTPVNDETDAPAGKSYDTTDNKPNTITTEDGTTYELVRVDGSETGTVVGGKTTEVTYVYRKVETPAKKVVTNHVDENGNPIAPQEDGTTPNKSIPGYEFTGKTVTDPDGNTTHIYRKVVTPVDPTDPVTPEDPTDPVTPVTPVDPKAPVQPGVPLKPETSAKPEAPAKPTYVAETLPNTGEDNSASVAAMGVGMILASLGLAAKRRRKED
ncbi:MucBP domain-containing protein [Streptococcus sp. 11273D007BT]